VRVTEISVADAGAGPYSIVTGLDGALWCTLVHAGQIGRLGLDGSVELIDLEPADSARRSSCPVRMVRCGAR
jgi:virginiamycin B lyase